MGNGGDAAGADLARAARANGEGAVRFVLGEEVRDCGAVGPCGNNKPTDSYIELVLSAWLTEVAAQEYFERIVVGGGVDFVHLAWDPFANCPNPSARLRPLSG